MEKFPLKEQLIPAHIIFYVIDNPGRKFDDTDWYVMSREMKALGLRCPLYSYYQMPMIIPIIL